MIVYLIRSDIPSDLVRATERQKVTSRARGQWHLSKNRSPFFGAGAARRVPNAHLLFEPRSRGRIYTHVHASRWHTRRVVRTYAYYPAPTCGPDLTKSGQMSIFNVAQVGAGRRRKPTRCIRASRLYACVRAYTREFGPDSLFESHVLYRWHCISPSDF